MRVLFICMAILPISLTAQNLQTEMDSVSYSLGILVAENLKNQGIEEIDAPSFSRGIADVIEGNEPTINKTQANQIVQAYMQEAQAKKYASQKEEGKKFLDENAEREGVKTLPSGLQYEVMEMGKGNVPAKNDKVLAHYRGTLIDGTQFDSSYDRGEPATFPVTGVIQGWQEALQMMPVGSKWKLYIPYDLAYGEQGYPPTIPPFSTLVFEIELLEIQ